MPSKVAIGSRLSWRWILLISIGTSLFNVTCLLLLPRDRIYFYISWIWSGIITCFDAHIVGIWYCVISQFRPHEALKVPFSLSWIPEPSVWRFGLAYLRIREHVERDASSNFQTWVWGHLILFSPSHAVRNLKSHWCLQEIWAEELSNWTQLKLWIPRIMSNKKVVVLIH